MESAYALFLVVVLNPVFTVLVALILYFNLTVKILPRAPIFLCHICSDGSYSDLL